MIRRSRADRAIFVIDPPARESSVGSEARMRTLTTILLPLGALLLAACDADPQACFPLERGKHAFRERELQGTSVQGTSVQGRRMQGVQMQGMQMQGVNMQGSSVQGRKQQGTAISASDLSAVRLELAATGEPVRLQHGRLSAGERMLVDNTMDVIATTPVGERIPMSIASIATPEGDERLMVISGGWTVCAEGRDGMFVPGSWDDSGAHVADDDVMTYACMDGVIAKCVDWGYAPWSVGAEMHTTCTRLARADYCGDGRSWTMDGTTIDVYDGIGVQSPVHDPELSFEAAWDEHGAVCVNAARYEIVDADGEVVVPECFAGLPQCTSLVEAARLGGVIANDSAHATIDACG